VEFEFTVDGKKHRVSTDAKSPTSVVSVDDRSYTVDWLRVEGVVVSLLIDEQSYVAYVGRSDGKVVVGVGGTQFNLGSGREGDDLTAAGASGIAASGRIKAPMPGTVVKVIVSEGDEIIVNQSLVIVEAMKMENEVRSPVDGVVSKVNVAAGDSVGTTDAMIEIEPKEAAQ
jgi:acetyl/propionyl-CoA carboxylase alpha subunit